MTEQKCHNCYYVAPDSENNVTCCRYPIHRGTSPFHWCGEWRAKPGEGSIKWTDIQSDHSKWYTRIFR